MKKYWNALRFGNKKTKQLLWSAIILFLLMIAGIVMFAVGAGAVWALVAVFSFVMILVLLQSVRFVEVKMKPKNKQQAKEKGDIREKEFESLADITPADIEQLFVAYKVNKSHTPIVIEDFKEEKVFQSPAYLWKDRGYLHMLVLGGKPKNIAVSLRRITKITCKRDVMAYPMSEYEELKRSSNAALIFQGLLPTYTERQRAGGRRYFTKNVYVLEPGIELTNTSIRNVQGILQLPVSFEGFEEETDSKYYREARRMKMLLVDKILTPGEYKEKIRSLLKEMQDSKSSREDFLADIKRMVQARLVTQEVAAYFVENHKKKKKK